MSEAPRVLTIAAAVALRARLRADRATVGLCHGCFDILHSGHVHHLQQASALVDTLFVSVTPDQYVSKGEDRPIFDDRSRAIVLGALRAVDYVVVNDEPTAASLILRLQPDIYFKGADYAGSEDPRLAEERQAVQAAGGRFVTTDATVFDSSSRAAAALCEPDTNHVPEPGV